MASKQTSVFNSFFVTAAVTIILGLITMYFGYYRIRLQTFQSYIADLQSKPVPDIPLSFSIETTGITEMNPEGENSGESVNPDEIKTESSVDPISMGKTAGDGLGTNSACGAGSSRNGSSNNQNSTKNGNSTSGRSARVRPPRKSAPDHPDDIEPAHRGPAFPRTQPAQTDEQSFDSGENNTEAQTEIPDIDDPELDDNPLIRALREASKRQAEDPDYEREENPPKNPFEAILNIQDN
ncbi:hypothetical protein JW823_02165 [bacterium]|nr:hypothetical protein [candidate division CSSED10-310 bacterium]